MKKLAHITVDAARELFGYEGRVVTGVSDDAEYLTDNPNRRCPVIEKARRELGYNPTVDVHDGVRRALIWYRENQTAEER